MVHSARIVRFVGLICIAVLISAVSPSLSLAQGQVVPRTIIGIYDSAQSAWQYTPLHQLAEMPLNYLGLVLEPWDLQNGLPPLYERSDVRGIVIWDSGDSMADPVRFLNWASDAVDAGKHFVLLGNASFMTARDGTPTSSDIADRFLAKLGIRFSQRYESVTYDSDILFRDPRVVEFERQFDESLPPYRFVQSFGPDTRAFLTVGRKRDGRRSDLVVTSPRGAYVSSEYTHYERHGEDGWRQWYINPFEFFRLAFATDDVPKPDVTTLGGRRMFLSHVDGDGWRNVTEISPYRKFRKFSAEVILREVLEKYPDLPVTVAPIAAELDPKWCGSEESIKLAREILALPYVEAGSHTFSHPLDWAFFDHPNIGEREQAYSELYKKQCGTGALHTRSAGARLNELRDRILGRLGFISSRRSLKVVSSSDDYKADIEEGETPRSFALGSYDLEKEVAGSVVLINSLLPEGKKVALYQWSGNTLPYRDAIAATRLEGLRNMNGGDTRLDREYPSMSWVAPVGRKVGDVWQVYSPNSNENTYTNLWSSRFFGFRYLSATLENTERPRRLKPINVYYHMYSGEKLAALAALQENLDFAREETIAPVRASHYAAIADGFFSTRITRLGARAWRFENRDRLSTVRFDGSETAEVDTQESVGVLGQTYHEGSLYVAIDPSVPVATIVLRKRGEETPSRPMLIDSRWPITDLTVGERGVTFRAEGFGVGEMNWRVVPRSRWQVKADDGMQAVDLSLAANQAGMLSFDIGFGAGRVTRVSMQSLSESAGQ